MLFKLEWTVASVKYSKKYLRAKDSICSQEEVSYMHYKYSVKASWMIIIYDEAKQVWGITTCIKQTN